MDGLALVCLDEIARTRFGDDGASATQPLQFKYLWARCRLRNGDTMGAIRLLHEVLRTQESVVEDHPIRLAWQHDLAGAHQANGRIEQAVALLEYVVRVEKAVWQRTTLVDLHRSTHLPLHTKRTGRSSRPSLYWSMPSASSALGSCFSVLGSIFGPILRCCSSKCGSVEPIAHGFVNSVRYIGRDPRAAENQSNTVNYSAITTWALPMMH